MNVTRKNKRPVSAEIDGSLGKGRTPGKSRRGKEAVLKACPWCRCPVSVYNYRLGSGEVGDWWCECENPGCKVNPASKHYQTRDELIESWNGWKEKKGDNGKDENESK